MSPKALSRQLNNSETAEPDILEFGCFYTHLGGDIMDPLYRAAVKGRVERKFAGKQDLQSKARPKQSMSAEREYKRLAREVDMAVIEAVKEALPKLKRICDRRYEDTHRYDAQSDDVADIQRVFAKALAKISSGRFDDTLRRWLTQLANLNRKLTVNEWKRVVKKTLGIDIFTDYYNGGNYQKLVDDWIRDNVALVKSVPSAALDEMQQIVMDGWYNSRSTKSIMQDLQRQFGVSKNKAKFLAVDQTAKLNAAITQYQQRDAGCEEYVWSSSGDSRVRGRHRELDGKTFRWDDPPIVDIKTGRRCHPGEDYRCRCVAIPKFNIESLNIPVEPKDWDAIDKQTKAIIEQANKRAK